jgi:two-component system, OmpR family, sensor histidine kinase KdpD
MKRNLLTFPPTIFSNCLFAFLSVFVLTIILMLIGRETLGEAVVALLYLLPVGWSAARWGQGAGVCAAVMASLAFDYFFIPPFYTFAVGRLEGWLVLLIFLVVSIVVVGRIQTGLTRASNSEREAIFMYEMSSTLAGLRTQEAVVHALATNMQLMFQAELVEVSIQPWKQVDSLLITAPPDKKASGVPDRILPILASPGLVGEIRIWRGYGWLPAEGSRLLSNFATQAAQALERACLAESEAMTHTAMNNNPTEG